MEDLKKYLRQLNGHVSMLLKVFSTGGDWKHQSRDGYDSLRSLHPPDLVLEETR